MQFHPVLSTKLRWENLKSTKITMSNEEGRGDERISASIVRRINCAKRTGILDFAGYKDPNMFQLKLSGVPGIVVDTFDENAEKALKELWLTHNSIKVFPVEIRGFSKLTTLCLSHNCLATLPRDIGLLRNLERLMLRGNKVTLLLNTIFVQY
jgi:hypothetical protein